MRGLQGKSALVTGGNVGIGEAISRRLAAEGVSVAVNWFQDPERAEAIAEELTDGDVKCIAVHGDVRDGGSVRAMFERARERLAPITILVNNAGVARHTRFLDIEEEEWEWIFQTNVHGAYRCAREAIPPMIEAGGGSVVNLSSELALVGEPELVHYVASKAAIIGLTKALAREVAPDNVRVNAVAPGPTDTAMLADEERSDEFTSQLPLRRIGRPEDIAATVAFLCSSDAEWYTGQVLSPNGGAVI